MTLADCRHCKHSPHAHQALEALGAIKSDGCSVPACLCSLYEPGEPARTGLEVVSFLRQSEPPPNGGGGARRVELLDARLSDGDPDGDLLSLRSSDEAAFWREVFVRTVGTEFGGPVEQSDRAAEIADAAVLSFRERSTAVPAPSAVRAPLAVVSSPAREVWRIVHESGSDLHGVSRELTDFATEEQAKAQIPFVTANRPGWVERLWVKRVEIP